MMFNLIMVNLKYLSKKIYVLACKCTNFTIDIPWNCQRLKWSLYPFVSNQSVDPVIINHPWGPGHFPSHPCASCLHGTWADASVGSVACWWRTTATSCSGDDVRMSVECGAVLASRMVFYQNGSHYRPKHGLVGMLIVPTKNRQSFICGAQKLSVKFNPYIWVQ